MDVLLYLLGVAAGVAVLVRSADWFTDASVEMARRARVPELIVGATLVSLATTLPEFAVSFTAAVKGQPNMAVGNAVGSAICNIGLILGFCGLLAPMAIGRAEFLVNCGGLLAIAALFAGLGYVFPDGSRWVGVIMLTCLALYLLHTIRSSLRQRTPAAIDPAPELSMTTRKMAVLFVAGAAGVLLGSNLMVHCAEKLARLMGISELVISLTLLAVGTSTPEFAVSLAGIVKKRRALAIGNIIGANVLNLSWVIGACSAVRPLPLAHAQVGGRLVRQSLVFDIPVMMLLTALLLVFGLTDSRLKRWEAGILFGVYAAYVTVLLTVFSEPAAV